MSTLRGFCTLNHYVDDVAAAVDWYSEFLGIDAYFQRSTPDGRLAYAEFRLGDDQDELGFIDRAFAPDGQPSGSALPRVPPGNIFGPGTYPPRMMVAEVARPPERPPAGGRRPQT